MIDPRAYFHPDPEVRRRAKKIEMLSFGIGVLIVEILLISTIAHIYCNH